MHLQRNVRGSVFRGQRKNDIDRLIVIFTHTEDDDDDDDEIELGSGPAPSGLQSDICLGWASWSKWETARVNISNADRWDFSDTGSYRSQTNAYVKRFTAPHHLP